MRAVGRAEGLMIDVAGGRESLLCVAIDACGIGFMLAQCLWNFFYFHSLFLGMLGVMAAVCHLRWRSSFLQC
jgi:hypothetical protein